MWKLILISDLGLFRVVARVWDEATGVRVRVGVEARVESQKEE